MNSFRIVSVLLDQFTRPNDDPSVDHLITKASLFGNLLNTYLITIMAIVVLIAIAAFLQKKIRLEHYEKTLIFVVAAISWVVAGINIFSSGAALSSLSTYINIVAFIM